MADYSWKNVQLSTIAPTTITTLASSIVGVQNTLQALKASSSAQLTVVPDVIKPVTSYLAAAIPLRDQLVVLMDSIFDSSLSCAQIKPSLGGYNYLNLQVRSLLSSDWDSDHPSLVETDWGFMVGFFTSVSMDLATIVFQELVSLFVSDPLVASKSNTASNLAFSPVFVPNWKREQFGRQGQEITTPWTKVQLVDLVPGGRDLMKTLRDTVEGLVVSDPSASNPLDQMLSLQVSQAQLILDEISLLESQISSLLSLFSNNNISILKIEPGKGGMTRLTQIAKEAFTPNAPGFPGTVSQQSMGGTGVILTGGGLESVAQVAYTTLVDLFGL